MGHRRVFVTHASAFVLIGCGVQHVTGLLFDDHDSDMLAPMQMPGLGKWAVMNGNRFGDETSGAYQIGKVLGELGFSLRVNDCGGAIDAVAKGFADARPQGELVSIYGVVSPYDQSVGVPVKQIDFGGRPMRSLSTEELLHRTELLTLGGTVDGVDAGKVASVFIIFKGGEDLIDEIKHLGANNPLAKMIYIKTAIANIPSEHYLKPFLKEGFLKCGAPDAEHAQDNRWMFQKMEGDLEHNEKYKMDFEQDVGFKEVQQKFNIAEMEENAAEQEEQFKRRFETKLSELMGWTSPATQRAFGGAQGANGETPSVSVDVKVTAT